MATEHTLKTVGCLRAKAPPLAEHLNEMGRIIAQTLGVAPDRVNVKVTSTDRLGAIGRGEGIAAQAVALLQEVGT